MNISVRGIEEEIFSLEDHIVEYSSIELTHANDNKAPLKVIFSKIIVYAFITAAVIGLFFF